MHNMNKNIISLALLTASFYAFGAADELRPQSKLIPSLQELALQRVMRTMTSEEEAQRFARDPQQCEDYVESLGINRDGAIKELIVNQLLNPYRHQIGDVTRIYRHPYYCAPIAWHPDGKLLASGLTGLRREWIRIFNWQTGQHLNELRGHRNSINSVSWHPKENILASGSDDDTVRIWNIAKAKEFKVRHWKLFEAQSPVNAVSWHPSGELLASGSDDGTVRIWNWKTGQEVNQLGGHHSVKLVSWHPSGELLASGSDDRMVRIWNWKTGQEVNQLRGNGSIKSISWHPDGESLAIGFSNGMVHLWKSSAGQEVERLDIPSHDPIVSVSWHPKGNLLAAVSNQKICVLNGYGPELRQRYVSGFRSSSWHPDRELLAFLDDGEPCVWDVQVEGRLISSLSLMQALYFAHYMKHAPVMQAELRRLVSQGKQEEGEGIDDEDYMRSNQDYFTRGIFFDLAQIGYEGYINVEDIKHDFDEVNKVLPTLKRKRFMRDLEASLPDELKNAVKREKQS